MMQQEPFFLGCFSNCQENTPQSEFCLKCCEKTLDECDNRYQQFVKRGTTLIQQKLYTDAIKCFNEMEQIALTIINFYNQIGDALKKDNEDYLATKYYNNAKIVWKNSENIFVNQFWVLVDKAKQDEANLLSQNNLPNSSTIKACHINTMKVVAQYIKFFDKFLEMNPEMENAYIQKSRLLFELLQHDQALDCLTNCLQIHPKSLVALCMKGTILQNLKRYQEALDCYSEMLIINPQDLLGNINKGISLFQMGKLTDALIFLQKALQIDPDHPETLCFQGLILFANKQYQEALHAYQKVLTIDPKSNEAYNKISSLLSLQDKNQEALQVINKLIKQNPLNCESHFQKGLILEKLGMYEDSLASLDQSILLFPLSDTYGVKGKILYKQGKIQEAIMCYEKACELDHSDYQTKIERGKDYLNLGQMLMRMDDIDQALQCFDEALDNHPLNPDALRGKGRALMLKKYNEEALKYFNKLSQIISLNWEDLQYRGAILAKLGNYEAALLNCEDAIKQNPNDLFLLIQKAIMLRLMKKYVQSLELFHLITSKKQSFWQAHYEMGQTLVEMGQNKEALQQFEIVLKINPQYPEAFLEKGKILFYLNDIDRALDCFDQALSLDSQQCDSHFFKGQTLKKKGQFLKAIEFFDNALILDPKFWQSYLAKGTTLLILKQYQQALTFLNDAIRLEPKSWDAHGNRGLALAELNRYDEAMQSYDISINLKPEQPLTYLNKVNLLYKLQKDEEAVQCMRICYKNNPKSQLVKEEYIALLFKLGKYNESIQNFKQALGHYEETLAIDPFNFIGVINKCVMLDCMQKSEKALDFFKIALGQKPEQFHMFYKNTLPIVCYFLMQQRNFRQKIQTDIQMSHK